MKNIGKNLLSKLKSLVKKNQTVLELGSGSGTERILKHCKVISIEENEDYVNKYHNNYIHAPVSEGWYHPEIVRKGLENKKYHLILIDGPVGTRNRFNFLKYFNLFKQNIPIIIDDVHRFKDLSLALILHEKHNFDIKIHKDKEKRFAVLIPKH